MNPTLRRTLMAVLGVAIGALCLWLAARNVDGSEAARIFRSADFMGIATGVALYGVAMVMRALRWRGILAFRAPVSAGMSLQALATGYAVNAALPARLGELFRADYRDIRVYGGDSKGFEIDRRKLQLAEPIKKLGDFTIPVKLHRDVVATVKVKVAAEGGQRT